MDHTVYRIETGEIVQSGWGEPHAPEGMAWLPGQFSALTHWVRDGVAIERPARPGPWATWDGQQWTDPRTSADLQAELAQARLAAVAGINAIAGEVRRRYVTDIPGQDALYLLKEAEARAWVASADPDPAQHPLIAAEIGITAPSGDEVAQVYLNLAGLYVAVAAQLETARLGHIALAEAAPDVASAEATAQAFMAILQQGA